MKKVFFSLMLIAALAFSFTSCKKTASDSETHSQTFTLNDTSYDINNAITIENIKSEGDVYNALVFSQGQMTSNNSGETKGVVIVFKGAINAGTYNLTGNDNDYPKYIFADITVEDIVNFDLNNLDNAESYFAINGAFTLEINDDTYTITTDGIEVENAKDPNVFWASSVDYEGNLARFTLADVEAGSYLNGVNIVTAGTTKFTVLFVETQIVAFITEEGDMLGFTSTSPFANGIPTGEFTNSDYPIILIEGMNINAPKFASSGNIVISKDGDLYTIDITDVNFSGVSNTYTMHYVGTMPYFDFPF